jgi:hypothetical protein
MSGRLYFSVLNAFASSLMATRKYSFSGGPPPPMRAVEDVIFQILFMTPTMTRAVRAAKRYSGYLASRRVITRPFWLSQRIERKSDCVSEGILSAITSISPI